MTELRVVIFHMGSHNVSLLLATRHKRTQPALIPARELHHVFVFVIN